MKITLNWLKQYVDFDWSPDDLAERLTMLGLEVERVEKVGGGFEGIVVAEVLSRQAHPNADKLSLCQVQDGQGQRQIVCGADNFKPGDKVALITPGASLPPAPGQKPAPIKVGKIRGVESQGMMCSPKELGLAEESTGLLILSPEAVVGQPFAQYLGRDQMDYVYDLEITPNRPDLNSVIGIAREISALTGHPLRMPNVTVASSEIQIAATDPHAAVDQYVAVTIRDAERCPRYLARIVRGVKIGPSPAWLSQTLGKIGVRSISNVVDVTNYVMMETGQPLHAFDYHLIAKDADGKPTVIVRTAEPGEAFITLDGQERPLTTEMLLIADASKGIALAGVMGGLNTEVNDQTVDVLLECAYFQPANIRRTSKALGLRSDSSYRFERGCDPAICDWASRRAAQLILETAGGSLVPGAVDACPNPIQPVVVTLRHARANALLGVTIPPADQVRLLESLDLSLAHRDGEVAASFLIPTFRVDLKQETDLIEEICRLHGVDRIPAAPPRGAYGTHEFDSCHDGLAEARQLLNGLGLDEAQGQTLIRGQAAPWAVPEETVVHLAHPLSADMNVLRPSLIPGLIEALRHNQHHGTTDVALYELGRVFYRHQERLEEPRRLAMALTGAREPAFWKVKETPSYDLYDLKGLLEEFLDQFGARGLSFLPCHAPAYPFINAATVQMGKSVLGELGQLDPAVARAHDLRQAVLLCELDLDLILRHRVPVRGFKSFASFPSSRRDVAMYLDEAITHENVLAIVRKTRPPFLERVELFDVFRGSHVPAGQKSVAYAFTYRSPERTLTDAEVNQAHEQVVRALESALHANARQ